MSLSVTGFLSHQTVPCTEEAWLKLFKVKGNRAEACWQKILKMFFKLPRLDQFNGTGRNKRKERGPRTDERCLWRLLSFE